MKKIRIKKINFRELFYNDKFVLIFSVFVSFIIWIFLAANGSQSRPVTISDIPVTITLSDSAVEDGLRVFAGSDVKAEVSVTGSRLVVGQLSKSNIQIVAQQASSITAPGNYTLELVPKKSGVITDYEFSSAVSPGFITVMVDRYREIEFVVEDGVKYKSDPAYFAASTTFSSPKVKVSGPESEISKIKKVVAQTEIPGVLKESKTVSAVPLVLYDSYGEVISNDQITLSVTQVDATVPILLRKVLPVSVSFSNQPENAPFSENQITIEPKELEIAAPESMFTDYNSVKLVALDFSKINLEHYEFEQAVDLPAGCKNLSNTYSGKIKIDMSEIKSRTITATNFSFINLQQDKQGVVNTKSMVVQILGPANQIDALTEADVVGEIDLKEKGNFTGHTEMPVRFRVDNYTGCWAYGDYTANVEISQK